MNKAQAIHKFWSSFGIPAYDQYTVPQDAQMPYITYDLSESDFDYATPMSASVWYRSQSWEDITLKCCDISRSLAGGGRVFRVDNGFVWIFKRRPFSQRMSDTDDMVRRMVINVYVDYFTRY